MAVDGLVSETVWSRLGFTQFIQRDHNDGNGTRSYGMLLVFFWAENETMSA
jgi:hypothetical protein